jgi:hypothetical protein
MGYESMTDEECATAGLPPITNRTPRGPALLFVHDQGVYLMSNGIPHLLSEDGNSHQVIYAEGCNPNVGEFDDWYLTSRDLVGGDDFVEILPIHDYWLGDCDRFETFEINATGSSISCGFVDPRLITAEFSVARVRNFLNQPLTAFNFSDTAIAVFNHYPVRTGGANLTTFNDVLDRRNMFRETVRHEIDDKMAKAGITATYTELANPITELNLSVRCRKCTTKLGLMTVYDLTQQTAADLKEIRNFGAVSLKEVREKLAERGLTLKGEVLENQRHLVSR